MSYDFRFIFIDFIWFPIYLYIVYMISIDLYNFYMCSMYLSHRSPEFGEIIKEAVALSREAMDIPDNYEVIDPSYVSTSLTRFSYLGEMSSLLVHNFMMRGIAHYMPSLIELEVS